MEPQDVRQRVLALLPVRLGFHRGELCLRPLDKIGVVLERILIWGGPSGCWPPAGRVEQSAATRSRRVGLLTVRGMCRFDSMTTCRATSDRDATVGARLMADQLIHDAAAGARTQSMRPNKRLCAGVMKAELRVRF